MPLADQAEATARSLLAGPLPRRWAHTQGVAAAARALGGILGNDTDLVTAAAWLHDIGYSPAIADTGFHPLDGARYLRDTRRADDLLCRLVAHHTGATAEAAERGLAADLVREFPPPPAGLTDALTYSDLTTGPDGQPMTASQRITEILTRYPPDHPVHRAISQSAPSLIAAAGRVTARLRASGHQPEPEPESLSDQIHNYQIR